MSQIGPSGIRRIFELMATMEDPINLSIGQAHFDAPEALVEAACRAIRAGHNRYTTTQGLAELNDRVRDSVAQRSGHRPEASLVTSGVSGGIFMSFLALLNPGDEILLPDPNFIMYRHLATLCGASIRYYDLYPDFRLDAAQLDELVTEKTKVILLNSPSNPTGGVLNRTEVAALASAADRVGAYIISDEIYDGFVYCDEFASPVGLSERVIQLGGFSKTYGVPGWRMGYATGPVDVLDAMKTLQQFSFVCAPAPFQHAILDAAFEVDIAPYLEEYRAKRDLLQAELHPAYELVAPDGAFYAFPRLPDGVEESAFIEAALARKLLVVPGSAFSRRNSHFRLSFAASDEDLRRGLGELRQIVETL